MTDDQLSHVERKIEESHEFSAEEVELLREIISAFRSLRALGRLTRFVVVALAAVGAALAAWNSIREEVTKWLGN